MKMKKYTFKITFTRKLWSHLPKVTYNKKDPGWRGYKASFCLMMPSRDTSSTYNMLFIIVLGRHICLEARLEMRKWPSRGKKFHISSSGIVALRSLTSSYNGSFFIQFWTDATQIRRFWWNLRPVRKTPWHFRRKIENFTFYEPRTKDQFLSNVMLHLIHQYTVTQMSKKGTSLIRHG